MEHATKLNPSFKLRLPNGLYFYYSSRRLRARAKYLTNLIHKKESYLLPGWHLREADIVVDIGANVGLFALWAAPQVPRGRVLSIEPAPAYDTLAANVSRNHLENVITRRVAAGRSGETIDLLLYPPEWDGMSRAASFNGGFMNRFLLKTQAKRLQYETVPTLSLPDLMAEYALPQVNFLKIDCEGGEYALFDAMTGNDWDKVERVAMEFHEFTPDQQHSKLLAALHENGFKTYVKQTWIEKRIVKVGYIWAYR